MTEMYNDKKFSAVVASTNSVTAGIDISTCNKLSWYINDSGDTSHTTHVVTLQFSHEDVSSSYRDSAHNITGLGCLDSLDVESVKWARAIVSTTEATSIIDICIDPSRERRRLC